MTGARIVMVLANTPHIPNEVDKILTGKIRVLPMKTRLNEAERPNLAPRMKSDSKI